MLTEKLADAISASGIKRGTSSGQASLSLKAASDTIVSPEPGAAQYDPDIVLVPQGGLTAGAMLRTRAVRNLIPEYPVQAGAVGYLTLTHDAPGTVGIVAEDGAKPQDSMELSLTTLPLSTVAGIFKASDEILEDIPRLAAAIRQEASDLKDLAVERQLLYGTGQDGAILGFMNDDRIPEGSIISNDPRGFFSEIAALSSTGYDADAAIMATGTVSRIFGQNSSTLSFAALAAQPAQLHAFGIPIVVTGAIQGGALIGDFRRGARIYSRGTSVDIGYDAEDFSHDRVTIRVCERLALAIVHPEAFVKQVSA